MEMQLDPAAAHYRQRLSEAEDNCAILTVQLTMANQRVQQLEAELAELKKAPKAPAKKTTAKKAAPSRKD